MLSRILKEQKTDSETLVHGILVKDVICHSL